MIPAGGLGYKAWALLSGAEAARGKDRLRLAGCARPGSRGELPERCGAQFRIDQVAQTPGLRGKFIGQLNGPEPDIRPHTPLHVNRDDRQRPSPKTSCRRLQGMIAVTPCLL
jgi:hypothetical protein